MKFKRIHACMVVLVTRKNEGYPNKNEGARVVTTLSIFLRCLRGANSIIGDGILEKFKLIQAFIVVLLICNYEEEPFKFESIRVVTKFLPL